MRYYLIAGEASGDLHGANLMKALRLVDAEAEFRFLGGDLMVSQGGDLVKHYKEMAYMGFLEVLMNLPAIMRNLKQAKSDLLKYKPDALVLIDFPGFNLKVAEFAKQNGIKVFYYISPKVWAWNQRRVLKIKKVVDKLFCILPFEVDFYKTWGMEVDYVGNPLLDAIAAFEADKNFREKHGFSDKPIVALLPGSRKQEILKILPEMLHTANRFPNYQFIIAGAPSFTADFYTQAAFGTQALPVVFSDTYNLLNCAHAAIVASGTATLETALFHVPQVVVYKTSAVSVAIARTLIKIKYISLVNLIMDKPVVKELIQEDCNPQMIAEELEKLLDGNYRHEMQKNYIDLSLKMGSPGASEKTAQLILQTLTNKH
ncbi:lipid-A-disaccharide synthase [Pedobacter sp. SYSU D00535]|uniref:lipid-A-disaccharide synthase n=1 Tax=Pedobacter sp. SYSU D00535 TaxID=2810308 RepID=UPI001A95CA1A|nr:lipid-A-disaccharide synthase [Pedobacter sp. SYSU D00535]